VQDITFPRYILASFSFLFSFHFGEKSTANFAAYILLFENYTCPFPKKLASHISMQKTGDKVDNKTNNKEGKEGKKDGERESRKICLFSCKTRF